MVNVFLWNEGKGGCHVFVIKAEPAGTGCGEGAVDKKFEHGHVSNFHAQVSGVVNEVATGSEACVVGYCFGGQMQQKVGIAGFPVAADFGVGNEEDCVSGINAVVRYILY